MEGNQELSGSTETECLSSSDCFKEFESVDPSGINPVSVSTGNPGDCPIEKSQEGTSHVIVVSGCGDLNGTASSTLHESVRTVVGTTPHSGHQPLILGNVNAAEMISSLLRQSRMHGTGQNTSLGLLNGQLVSIVPIVVQGQPITLNDPVVSSKEEVESSTSSFTSSATFSLPELSTGASVDTVPSLSTSDTVILNSSVLSQGHSNRISSTPSTFILPNTDSYSKTDCISEKPSLLSTNYSTLLQNQISNRIVSLNSIPTVSLFNPVQKEISAIARNRGHVVTTSLPTPVSVGSNQSSSCSSEAVCVGNEQISQPVVVANKCKQAQITEEKNDEDGKIVRKKRGKMSGKKKNQAMLVRRRSPRNRLEGLHAKSETGELHILDEDQIHSDTDMEEEENSVDTGGLSREDTVIIHSEKDNHPKISTEDTVILPTEDSVKVDQSEKLSEGFSFTSLNSLNGTSPLLQAIGSKLSFGKSFVLQQEGGTSMENLHSAVPLSLISNESFAKLLETQASAAASNNETTPVQCEPPPSGLVSQGSVSSLPSISSVFSLNLSQWTGQHALTKESQSTQTDLALGNRVVPTELLQLLSRLNSGQLSILETLAQNTQFEVYQQQNPQSVSSMSCPPGESYTEVFTVVNSESDPQVEHGDDDCTLPEDFVQFPCERCSAKFATQEELEKHQDTHKKTIKCDLCSATFARMGNYTRHRKIHNLQNETRDMFKCDDCGREFLQRCDLKRHLLIHAKKEPHRCSECGKGYVRRSDLVVHMRFHNKDKAFKCPMCDKSFYQTGDLSRHKRRAHYPSSQLTCGHCDKKYACEATLMRHMKCVHKDIILQSVTQKLRSAKSNKKVQSPSEAESNKGLFVSMTQNPPEEK